MSFEARFEPFSPAAGGGRAAPGTSRGDAPDEPAPRRASSLGASAVGELLRQEVRGPAGKTALRETIVLLGLAIRRSQTSAP